MPQHQTWSYRLKPFRTLFLALLVLLPVESASSWSLYRWYLNFEPAVPAALIAMAFCTLTVTLLVLAAQPLPKSSHRWLLAGVTILLTVTALANVGEAFLQAETVMPADRLTGAMGLGMGAAHFLVAIAWVCGLAIPSVCWVAWSGLAQYLRQERARAADARAVLAEAMRALHENSAAKKEER